MATSANLPPGAIPANGFGDPFVSGSPGGPLRYASLDTDQLSMYSANSPAHAKRALEAHLKDTDRRIQDASRLGTTLLQQRRELSARMKDVEQAQEDHEMPTELRKKLADLEREYNEVGRESARAFLPRTRAAGGETGATPVALSGSGRESPTKVSAPSRRQRNQPSSRVHDIEFATEISTSLLAQVRQLQSVLAEKDDMLKDANNAKAQMEADLTGMSQRMKHMDESEQRYKDENWNLEMRLQELEAGHRDISDKHDRIALNLKAAETEKASAQRELDELKLSHERLNDDHAMVTKQQEGELHGLRREAEGHQTESEMLHKKVEDLTAQNAELAQAVSYRWNQPAAAADREFVSAAEDRNDDDLSPEHSESASPVKGTPRHGMLESETLRSSLNHAHRMIQNLKNNIHREKTEKLELKRMLQDARDELETRRGESGIAGNAAKKRRSDDSKFKKPARPDRLGANRISTTEILEDEPDWEDHEIDGTPSKSRSSGAAAPGAFPSETDSTDAFETATERDAMTETEAFETGNEGLGDDDDGEATETESGFKESGGVRGKGVSPLTATKAGDRSSFMSTASTSADEADDIRTPIQNQGPKYRLRVGRGARRSGRVSDVVTDSPRSPASSQGTPQPLGQTLGDELDAMDEDSGEGSPNRESFAASPETQRQASVNPADIPVESIEEESEFGSPLAASRTLRPEDKGSSLPPQSNTAMVAHEQVVKRPEYADAGVMTEPWAPEHDVGLRERAAQVVGGALAGFGLGRLGSQEKEASEERQLDAGAEETEVANDEHFAMAAAKPSEDMGTGEQPDAGLLGRTTVSTEPKSLTQSIPGPLAAFRDTDTAADTPNLPDFEHSAIVSQATEPVSPPRQSLLNGVSTPLKDPVAASAPIPVLAEEQHTPQQLSYSTVNAQAFEPSPVFATPHLPARSSGRLGMLFDGEEKASNDERAVREELPGTDGALPGAGFFTTAPLVRNRSLSTPASQGALPVQLQGNEKSIIEPRVFGGMRSGSEDIPTLVFGDDSDQEMQARAPPRVPLGEVPLNVAQQDRSPPYSNFPPIAAPLVTRKPMADEGSQTAVSGDEIEEMMRNKSMTTSTAPSMTDAAVSPIKPTTATRRSSESTTASAAVVEALQQRGPRKPASAGSVRSKAAERIPPPLPENYTQKITAASQKGQGTLVPATAGAMGPPVMPASSYKQGRPKTPAERVHERSLSRDGTTPRPVRTRESKPQMQSPSGLSRRTSVSSFASELDDRFNIARGHLIFPSDVKPSTDPRMIQAITQTMIGEYLWKYTRKAGRSETSKTRHRRFFWIHPYTRTLYWSERDPSTAGASMLKAKSMAIQAVRVVTDDNAYPPGLHRKSIVVVTPGREIVFTAPTGQRHETWNNALSYLLLRTEQEKGEAEDEVNDIDAEEFHPGFNIVRSISRMTGRDRSRSRNSLSSYNSRTTRTSSPQKREAGGSLAQRQSAAAARSQGATTPTLHPLASEVPSHTGTVNNPPSMSGRLSSFTSKFRPGSSQRGSFSTGRGHSSFSTRGRNTPNDPSDIYDASVVAESAEDLHAVIQRQEEQADRLENVRACCDGQYILPCKYRYPTLTTVTGKHDVGSLARGGGKHTSFSSRLGGAHSHTHSHAHPPKAEPMSVSSRPRRGE